MNDHILMHWYLLMKRRLGTEIDKKLEYINALKRWDANAFEIEKILLQYAPPEMHENLSKHFIVNRELRDQVMGQIVQTATLCCTAKTRGEQIPLEEQLSTLCQTYINHTQGHYVGSETLMPYYNQALHQPTVITSIHAHRR